MDVISREYTLLFAGVSDTIEELEKTVNKLKSLQQMSEEIYIANNEEKMAELTDE